MPTLCLLTGPSAGLRHPLSAETTLGRSPSCDIPLDDEKVSRRHVQLVLEAGRVLLRDLGSRNGTWVDGVRIEREMELRPGTTFQLGETTIRLDALATAAEAPEIEAVDVTSGALDRLVSENAARELIALARALGTAPDRPSFFERLSEHLGRICGANASFCIGPNEPGRIPEALASPARNGELALSKGELCAPVIDVEGGVAGLYFMRREGAAFGVAEQSRVAAAMRLSGSFLGRRGDFDHEADAPAPGLSAAFAEAKRLLTSSGRVLFVGEVGSGKGLLTRMLCASAEGGWGMIDARAAGTSERLADAAPSGWGVVDLDGLPVEGAHRLSSWLREDPSRKLVATLRADASVPWRAAEPALWQELESFRVKVPALHERAEDLPGLFARFAERAARRRHQPPCRLGKSARERLLAMRFERNVSELKLFAERLSLLHPGVELTEAHMGPGGAPQRAGKLDDQVSALEKEAIAAALREAKGKKVHAAAILGISRPTLDKKIQQYGLTVRKGDPA